jgi:hypothetical protein
LQPILRRLQAPVIDPGHRQKWKKSEKKPANDWRVFCERFANDRRRLAAAA